MIHLTSIQNTFWVYALSVKKEKGPRNAYVSVRKVGLAWGISPVGNHVFHQVRFDSSELIATLLALWLSLAFPLHSRHQCFHPCTAMLSGVLSFFHLRNPSWQFHRNRALRAAWGQPAGKSGQLVVVGFWSICCVEDQWGHSHLEVAVLWRYCISADGDIL